MTHLIVGAGGTASWLVPLLKHTLKPGTEIRVMDGDILEARNLDRQIFGPEYIGWNKAEALANVHDCQWDPTYLDNDTWFLYKPETVGTIWCCADNHPARKVVLELVDQGYASIAIIGGNEYTDAEAYGYLSAWKDTAADPRIYYPELLTDQSNDPLNPACQGINQAQNRQLALANYLAAGFMVHLWWFITQHGTEVLLPHWPTRHWANFTSFNSKPYQP